MVKKNNFDFLRLIFASFVIITHSYPLSGIEECDWLCQITNDQISFSALGVEGFFILSGYLIFQSLDRSLGLIDFYWKRILRIFPALLVLLILTVLLVPFVYQSNIPIIQNKSFWTYVPRNITLYGIQYHIIGVFDHNPLKSVINASLWTIPYEFTMYIFLSFLIGLRKQRIVLIIILLSFYTLFFLGNLFFSDQLKTYDYILNLKHLCNFGLFFFAGALLSAIQIEKIKNQVPFIFFLAILLSASVYFNSYNLVSFIGLPLLLILFGLNSIPLISSLSNKIGDLSYGIYIYGFPIQQALMYYYNLQCIELTLLSLLLSSIFALLSWHLIEKRALKLKVYTRK